MHGANVKKKKRKNRPREFEEKIWGIRGTR
jgi:hypothetical protein